jgi:hypothetical protein
MLQWHGPTSASDPRCRTECSRLDATARGWCLASRHRPNERRARARSSRFGRPRPLPPTAALNDGGFPGPRRLPPAGGPCRAHVDPGVHGMHARFDRWRSFTRRGVPLRASSTRTPSAATEGAHTERSATKPTSATVKEHGHTDGTACASHGTRCFSAFRRSGASRNCERHDLRS